MTTAAFNPVPSTPPYGPAISLELATRVVAEAETHARRHGWAMVFAVVDSAAQLVVFRRMDGVHHAALSVAQAKACTSVNFRRPTRVFEDAVAGGGAGLRFLSVPGLCPMEGGIPLVHNGQVIGAIGVSGVGSAEDGQTATVGASVVHRSQEEQAS